jgi:hypothetical protein
LDISKLNTSDPEMAVNGVSGPSAWAMPMAMAVLPGMEKMQQE